MPRRFNKKNKLHVKKGDEVQIIAGVEKGKQGRVLYVIPKKQRVVVEGLNMRVYHEKPSQDLPKGGRIEREGSIHVSNVMVIDPTTGEPSRIGRKRIEDDKGSRWVRYAKSSGEILDS